VEKIYGKGKTQKALHNYDVYTILKYKRGTNDNLFQFCSSNFWGINLDEGTDWSLNALDNRLANLEYYQQARINFIKYAPNVPRDRERHLHSKYFSYFSYSNRGAASL
jgi:hypothetical protein